MPVHERQRPPAGHGEVMCSPPYATWAEIAESNAAAVRAWPVDLAALRELARAESIEVAQRHSAQIGVSGGAGPDGLIVATGHQPILFHPGVWVKHFLAQRFADETGALAIDVVVDTDAAAAVEMRAPCLAPAVRACAVDLTPAMPERAYVQVPVPDEAARERFRAAGRDALATLPAPALERHFTAFCDALDAQATAAHDVATLVTGARRAYERPIGTDYLELPVSQQAITASFRTFAASLLVDAARFREVMNRELAAYRDRTGTRSAAQPFPDLGEDDGRIEAPFWLLDDRGRATVSIDPSGDLYAGDRRVLALGRSVESARAALEQAGLVLGPKALALTMFERLFVADLFIHGTGGGRYDRVTDAVVRSYFGIEPPAYVVASMTMLLPLGERVTTDADVAVAEQRLARLEHNPDQLLDEIEFDTVAERREAERLAAEKARLVAAIAASGADRKALGREIRSVNAALSEILAPLAAQLRSEVEQARASREARAVLTDRTYPFCLWDPREVMDKVR